MKASVIHNTQIFYPDDKEFFSPSEQYPEYPFAHTASRPNLVYQAVRNYLAQARLDTDYVGTPNWNPLGEFIKNGDKVFVLCNFVYHRRPKESLENFFGKYTHGSILRIVIDNILIATGLIIITIRQISNSKLSNTQMIPRHDHPAKRIPIQNQKRAARFHLFRISNSSSGNKRFIFPRKYYLGSTEKVIFSL